MRHRSWSTEADLVRAVQASRRASIDRAIVSGLSDAALGEALEALTGVHGRSEALVREAARRLMYRR